MSFDECATESGALSYMKRARPFKVLNCYFGFSQLRRSCQALLPLTRGGGVGDGMSRADINYCVFSDGGCQHPFRGSGNFLDTGEEQHATGRLMHHCCTNPV